MEPEHCARSKKATLPLGSTKVSHLGRVRVRVRVIGQGEGQG